MGAATSIYRIDASALISRFLNQPFNVPEQLLVTLVVLGLAASALLSLKRTHEDSNANASVSIICVAVLMSVFHQGYDLLLLILPLVAVARHRLPAAFQISYVRWSLLGLFAMLAVNYANSYGIVARFRPEQWEWLVLSSINGAVVMIIYSIYVLIAFRVGVREKRALGTM